MTLRRERDQRLLEWKAALIGRLAGRAMSNRTGGLDGLAKTLLRRRSGGAVLPD